MEAKGRGAGRPTEFNVHGRVPANSALNSTSRERGHREIDHCSKCHHQIEESLCSKNRAPTKRTIGRSRLVHAADIHLDTRYRRQAEPIRQHLQAAGRGRLGRAGGPHH